MSGIKTDDRPTFKKLQEIAQNQTTTIKQQDQIRSNLDKQTDMKRQQLELDIAQFEAAKHADLRHELRQCIDFAINSLPWWNRGTSKVVDRATEYLLAVRKETAKHVAMEVLAKKIQTESLEEFMAETEELLDGIIGEEAKVGSL
jgi:hypothetical protein